METAIQLEREPSQLRQLLDEQITSYNMAITGIADAAVIALSTREEGGRVTAGLFGWTWGGTLFVEFLWVEETWRGCGTGSRLLRTAEQEARARGCTQALLGTHSFQAPGFYQKHGYEVYGVAADYPRGYAQYHLRKALV